MNDNVKKVFEILGVEPNEKFKVDGYPNEYELDENLYITVYHGGEFTGYGDTFYSGILNGQNKIIKPPKEPKKNKKKLRELTPKEFDKWQRKNCDCIDCRKCLFANTVCYNSTIDNSWVNHKDLYSDKFLDQEIEVEE